MIDWLRSIFTAGDEPSNGPLPQLEMIRNTLDGLPEIVIPDGYELRTYREGDERAWCAIMENNLGKNWTFEKCRNRLVEDPRFSPENLFFATLNDQPVASACSWRTSLEEQVVGEVHMVAALEDHRGKGLGNLVNVAVLHRLKAMGFQRAHLLTDDWRLAAIGSYLKIGFSPLTTHISHAERWEAITATLDETKRAGSP